MKHKIFIYIPFWKNLNELRECLQAISKNTLYLNYSTILIDDGSHQQIPEHLPGLERTVKHARNKGFTYSINTARKDFLKTAKATDFLLLLNSDTLPQHNWLSELSKAALKYKDTGIFAAQTISSAKKVIGGGTRHILNKKQGLLPLDKLVLSGAPGKFGADKVYPWAEFAAVLITPACLKKCGAFAGRFRHFGSDVEYCYRARAKGFQTRYIAKSKVIHKKQSSLKKLTLEHRLLLLEDLKKLKRTLAKQPEPI